MIGIFQSYTLVSVTFFTILSSHFSKKFLCLYYIVYYKRIAQSSIVHNSPAINVSQMHAHQPSNHFCIAEVKN